jgi:hypothetical protein
MAIETTEGGTIITGEHIPLYRLLVMKQALKLETLGMKRRGESVHSIVKREFGFKGDVVSVYAQLSDYIEEKHPL